LPNPFTPVTPAQYGGWASFYGGNVTAPSPPPPSAFGSAALGQPPSNGQYQGGWAYPDAWANFYEGTQGFTAPQNQNSPAGALAAENYATNINNPNDPNLLGWEQAYGNPQTILAQDQNWAQSLGPAPLTGNISGGWANPEAWAAYYGGTNGFSAPANAGSPASALAAAATISQTSNPQDNPALLGWVADYGQPGSILANTPNWAASLGTPDVNSMGQDIGQTNTQSWESPLAWAAFYGGLQGYTQPVDNNLQAAENWEGVTSANDPSLLGWELDYGNPQTVVSTIEASAPYQAAVAAQKAQEAAAAAAAASPTAPAGYTGDVGGRAGGGGVWQNIPGVTEEYYSGDQLYAWGPATDYTGVPVYPTFGGLGDTVSHLQATPSGQYVYDPVNPATGIAPLTGAIPAGAGGGGGGGVTPQLNDISAFTVPQPSYIPATSGLVLGDGSYSGYIPGAFADTGINPLSNDQIGTSATGVGGPIGPTVGNFDVPTQGIQGNIFLAGTTALPFMGVNGVPQLGGLPGVADTPIPTLAAPIDSNLSLSGYQATGNLDSLAQAFDQTAGNIAANYSGSPLSVYNDVVTQAQAGLIPQLSAPNAAVDPFAGAPIPSITPDFNQNVDDYGRPIPDVGPPAPVFDTNGLIGDWASNIAGVLSNLGIGWSPDLSLDLSQFPDITTQQGETTAPGIALTPYASQQGQSGTPGSEVSSNALSDLLGSSAGNAQQIPTEQQQFAPPVADVSTLALQSGLQGNVVQSDFPDGTNTTFPLVPFDQAQPLPFPDLLPTSFDLSNQAGRIDTGGTPTSPEDIAAAEAPIDWTNLPSLEGVGLTVNSVDPRNANERLVLALKGDYTIGNLLNQLGISQADAAGYGINPGQRLDPTKPLQQQIDAIIANLGWLVRSSAPGMLQQNLAQRGLSIQGIQSALNNPALFYGQIGINGPAPAPAPDYNPTGIRPPADVPQTNNVDWANLPSLGQIPDYLTAIPPQGYFGGGQQQQQITIPQGYFGGGQQQQQIEIPQGYFGGGFSESAPNDLAAQLEPGEPTFATPSEFSEPTFANQPVLPQGYFGGGAAQTDYNGLGLSPALSNLSQMGVAPPEFSLPGVYQPTIYPPEFSIPGNDFTPTIYPPEFSIPGNDFQPAFDPENPSGAQDVLYGYPTTPPIDWNNLPSLDFLQEEEPTFANMAYPEFRGYGPFMVPNVTPTQDAPPADVASSNALPWMYPPEMVDVDRTAQGARRAPGGQDPLAFIAHNTEGGANQTWQSVNAVNSQRGPQYVQDREGNIWPGGSGAYSIRNEPAPEGDDDEPFLGYGQPLLNNSNTVGMESITGANDNTTQMQIASFVQFINENYPNTPVAAHPDVNPGHKQSQPEDPTTEGGAQTDALNAYRDYVPLPPSDPRQGGQQYTAPVTPDIVTAPQTTQPGFWTDVPPIPPADIPQQDVSPATVGLPGNYYFGPGQSAPTAAITSPEAISAFNSVGQALGVAPAALAMVAMEESAGSTTNVSGSYKGLFQENLGGGLAPFSSVGILQQSPAQQINNYQNWWNSYGITQQLQAVGLQDLSGFTVAQQAALIQAFQFAPNHAGEIVLNVLNGNINIPATTSRQAADLGNTSFSAMSQTYLPRYVGGGGAFVGPPY
jgi:hypothetical protein